MIFLKNLPTCVLKICGRAKIQSWLSNLKLHSALVDGLWISLVPFGDTQIDTVGVRVQKMGATAPLEPLLFPSVLVDFYYFFGLFGIQSFGVKV